MSKHAILTMYSALTELLGLLIHIKVQFIDIIWSFRHHVTMNAIFTAFIDLD